ALQLPDQYRAGHRRRPRGAWGAGARRRKSQVRRRSRVGDQARGEGGEMIGSRPGPRTPPFPLDGGRAGLGVTVVLGAPVAEGPLRPSFEDATAGRSPPSPALPPSRGKGALGLLLALSLTLPAAAQAQTTPGTAES